MPPRSVRSGTGFRRLMQQLTASPHIRSDRYDRYPHSACLRRGSHEDETHLRSGCLIWPKGGTVIIHPALTAARCRGAGACLKRSPLRLDHGPLGDQAGGEVAPQRHHQLARQGDDGDALDPLAGLPMRC